MKVTAMAADQLPLIGIGEIAVILGIDQHDVPGLTLSPDWPTPVVRISSGSVWRTTDISLWARLHAADLPARAGGVRSDEPIEPVDHRSARDVCAVASQQ